MTAAVRDVTTVRDLVCDHCGAAHVRAQVTRTPCHCDNGIAVSGTWMGQCRLCPGDGWLLLYSDLDVTRQMRACAGAQPGPVPAPRQTAEVTP